MLVLLLFLYAQERGRSAFADRGLPGHVELLIAVGALAACVVLAVALSALSWRATRFTVDDEAVRLHSGVIAKRQRVARLDRLQAVDVVQPLVARLLGFAELRVEVAGGAGSQVRLAYLREADAQRLRNLLLARSAGLDFEGDAAPEAPEQQVVEVPFGRVAGSVALSGATVTLVVLAVGVVVGVVTTQELGVAFGAAAPLIGVAGSVWTSLSRSANWRVATSPDGVRLRSGLLESRTQTVPPGRVQAVRLSQPLLWRAFGWWRVQVNVAGFAGEGEQSQDASTLLPVASVDEVRRVLSLVLPALHDDLHAPGLNAGLSVGQNSGQNWGLDEGLRGTSPDGGWLVAPRAARWVDPVSWRRRGALVTEHALLLRSGRLRRELDVVPHARTQSLAVEQGPLQRRLGLATLALHSTPGPVRPRAEHLTQEQAVALLDEQALRARTARAAAGPERWMEQAG
ncbi:putative membrane protein [Quadrisphaera granulorum]|uniref:Putative membrane protein n=1 Tax=Quadrisphaera granulorum TaxID=317664 RepID=A0A316A6H5_9ACTN|nr:putative membrane protein [Quadrisphaera granulorum]SZE96969.1 putative membrane protein [Quadrisphaera granulorum]